MYVIFVFSKIYTLLALFAQDSDRVLECSCFLWHKVNNVSILCFLIWSWWKFRSGASRSLLPGAPKSTVKQPCSGERWILAFLLFWNCWSERVLSPINLAPVFTPLHLPLFTPDCGPVCWGTATMRTGRRQAWKLSDWNSSTCQEK